RHAWAPARTPGAIRREKSRHQYRVSRRAVWRLEGSETLGSPCMTAAEKQAPDRNLAMELVRVTEAAALAASRWMGRGEKESADGAAVEAMRVVLHTVAM